MGKSREFHHHNLSFASLSKKVKISTKHHMNAALSQFIYIFDENIHIRYLFKKLNIYYLYLLLPAILEGMRSLKSIWLWECSYA